MGVYAVQWAFQTPILSPGAKFVLVALAEHARDEAPTAGLASRRSNGSRSARRRASGPLSAI